MRILRNIALALFTLALFGCSGNQTNSSGAKEIVISSLLKNLGLGANINSIVLSVSGAGFDDITRTVDIVDGAATIILDVPIGEDRTFAMTAFDAESVALYSGSTIADVLAGQVTEVNIRLEPLVAMIRVSPMFTETDTDTQKPIRIFVHNVDSLFGASFRLEYDTNIVAVASVTEGNIFGDRETLFFTQQRPGYVAVAFTLLGNQSPQGVSSDGTLAVIQLTPRLAGTTALAIPQNTLNLIDWQSNTLPRQGVLYIEEGEIRVDAP
ncbi:MAG: cohesin domain-containing protein [Candidatus Zixiibacteriota bacterium]